MFTDQQVTDLNGTIALMTIAGSFLYVAGKIFRRPEVKVAFSEFKFTMGMVGLTTLQAVYYLVRSEITRFDTVVLIIGCSFCPTMLLMEASVALVRRSFQRVQAGLNATNIDRNRAEQAVDAEQQKQVKAPLGIMPDKVPAIGVNASSDGRKCE